MNTPKRYAALVGNGLTDDRVFRQEDDRDGSTVPFVLLQQALSTAGIELHTSDVLQRQGLSAVLEIHVNAQRRRTDRPTYVLLFETPHIRPLNGRMDVLQRYRKVFTWRPDLWDGKRFLPLRFPNPLRLPDVDGFAHRPLFASMIAGNKACSNRDGRELYSERVRTIRWFERHHPEAFTLYGPGWNTPPKTKRLFGRMFNRLQRLRLSVSGQPAFPSWKGTVKTKAEVLERSRFCICYENVRDFPGYITEKIFDCFFSGCVPVYWGPADITDTIPAACFVDRRAFSTHEALYAHLQSMTEVEYHQHQYAMVAFLQSDAAQVFTAEHFARTVSEGIVGDLETIAP